MILIIHIIILSITSWSFFPVISPTCPFFCFLIYLFIKCLLFLMLLFQRWEVSVRRRQHVIGGVWAPSCLSSWQAWWVKKYKKKMLSLLLRCCGMSVGVLAFNSLTLFMVVPDCVCVWSCARVCMCLSRWRLLFVLCICVCERCVLAASLTLVLGECQGCRCDFLPQPELHLLGQGVSSPRASLLAPGAALGFEHADPRSAWKVKTRAALKVLELGWSRIRAVWGTDF